MNKVFLSGNLTRDPEVRYSQSGKAFARMGIAVRRNFSKDKEAVDFFNLTAWEKTAEFCQRYMTKGTRVLVEGQLRTSSYENKDGVKVNSVDVWIDNIEFAGAKPQGSGGGGDYSGERSGGGGNYNRSNDSGYSRRAPAPRKNNYNDDFGGDDFGGEQIDPDDTPF